MKNADTLFSLAGKTAVVTGALGLLGKEHCRALAAAGARIVPADLDGRGCEEFACALTKELECEAMGIALDVTAPRSVESARDAVRTKWGTIDVLVNNAAINDKFEDATADQSRFEAYPLAQWKQSLEVNVTGIFLCSQILGSVMAEQRRGSIINIASTYGIVAPDQSLYRRPGEAQTFFKTPSYPTTKGAVIAFTRYLAAYWGGTGVRVNALSPGGVENGQEEYFIRQYAARTPLGRMAKAGDYRGAVVFLASDASLYMTGANLVVDGGWTIW
jgi:NAD(P)-dependent dehydrogenase (short-subunit alcohol dehydrogenase family)